MAVWGGVGQAAMVAQLARMDPFGLIAMIMQAAMKAHNNREECEQLARRVSIIGDLLPELQRRKTQVARPVLDELNHVLVEAHLVIQSFQERSMLYQFVMAWREEERLRGAKSKVDSALALLPFANFISIISRIDPNYNSPPTHHQLTGQEVVDEELEIHYGEGGEKFTVEELAAATNNYQPDREISRSNSGTVVYKGRLADGRKVAIKSVSDNYSMELFDAEASILLPLRHKHIIRLFGTLMVLEKDSTTNEYEVVCRMQVLEFMKNGSLADHIHGRSLPSSPVRVSWKKRIKILLGVSRAINYLHNRAAVVHGDINSSNILLSSGWKPHLSGFEFSLTRGDQTECYPEHDKIWNVTLASEDLYCFGVVMLEVLTGKEGISYPEGEDVYGVEQFVPTRLVDLALPLIAARNMGKMLDKEPAAELTPKERKALCLVARTAARCVQVEEDDRPRISYVVRNLKKAYELLRADE